jgi:hypothetical protein
MVGTIKPDIGRFIASYAKFIMLINGSRFSATYLHLSRSRWLVRKKLTGQRTLTPELEQDLEVANQLVVLGKEITRLRNKWVRGIIY